MSTAQRVILVLLLLSAFGILLVVCTLQISGDSFLLGEIQNTGHTPVFGLLSLTMLGLSRLLLGNRLKNGYMHYLVAFTVTVIIGALIEYIQVFGPRDADLWDLVRDAAGAFSFLGVYAAADQQLARKWSRTARLLIRAVSILVLLAALTPLALWAGAYLHRDAIFPKLLTFDSVLESKFLTVRNAEVARVSPPSGFTSCEGGTVGKLIMHPDTYCGFRIAEPCPDWSGFSFLRFDIYNEIDSTVNLVIRIDDIHHNSQYEDRYNRAFRITPGLNRISVDLQEVRVAPSSREMDMTAIQYIYFFTYMPKEPVTLYIDNVTLQG